MLNNCSLVQLEGIYGALLSVALTGSICLWHRFNGFSCTPDVLLL